MNGRWQEVDYASVIDGCCIRCQRLDMSEPCKGCYCHEEYPLTVTRDAGGNDYLWYWKGRWVKHLPLPWHVRFRLAVQHQIDGLAIWLVDHDRLRSARAVWRITGRW
jgi:hypothetical protein